MNSDLGTCAISTVPKPPHQLGFSKFYNSGIPRELYISSLVLFDSPWFQHRGGLSLFKSPASPRTSCAAIIRQLPNLVMQFLSYRNVGRFEKVHPVVRCHDGSRHSIDRSMKTTKSAEMSMNQEPAKQYSWESERREELGRWGVAFLHSA